MELFSVLKFELKRNLKAILIFGGVVGGFILLMSMIFDPTLFAEYNDILEGVPPEILALIGGIVDLSTFEGFFNLYIFEFAWMWYGLYIILFVAQDIPGELEKKTIDLVLSKPIKRWEFVIGKQICHIITIFVAMLFSAVFTVISIAINPNIDASEVGLGGFMICFVWLGMLLVAMESTVLLISTIAGSKKATILGFGIVMGLWFISAYSGSIPIKNIEYISFFTFFDSRAVIIDGVMADIVAGILILLVYSAVFSTMASLYFTKRDIPV